MVLFFNKTLEIGEIIVGLAVKHFSWLLVFLFGCMILFFGTFIMIGRAGAMFPKEINMMKPRQNETKASIVRVASLCDEYFVKNPATLSLKLKEDNRAGGVWAFNFFQTPAKEIVAVRKVNGRFHGLFTCGSQAYGNLNQRTVREGHLLEKTGALNYRFQTGFLEEQRFDQIFSEAYKRF